MSINIVNFQERCIFLFVPIDDTVANLVCRGLLSLNKRDNSAPIEMYINSPGGMEWAVLAIYDVMRYIKAPVHTICVGTARGLGAFLLAGGEPGERRALPSSTIVMEPMRGGIGMSQTTDIKIHASRYARLEESLNEMLAGFTGKTYDQICKDTKRARHMDAWEAKDYGLVDRIVEPSPE